MLINGSPLTSLVVPEVDAVTPLALSQPSPSLSSTGTRTDRQTAKRRAASEWISMALGEKIPYETDAEFRSALADGVVLCRLVNWVRPGTIPKVVEGPVQDVVTTSPNNSAAHNSNANNNTGEVIQTFENVSNFIKAARSLVGETFSACDLEQTSEERAAVVESVLSLRDLAAGRSPKPLLGNGSGRSPGSNAGTPLSSGNNTSNIFATLPSPGLPRQPGSKAVGTSQTGTPNFPPPRASPGFSFTPAAAQFVAKHGIAASSGADAPDGLNHLMRSCTHMLRNRMGLSASPLPNPGDLFPAPSSSSGQAAGVPPFALDAVGPVLENVLSNLTSEYEKRLLSKDQEFKLAQEAQDRMRRQITRLQAEMESWKIQAEALVVEQQQQQEAADRRMGNTIAQDSEQTDHDGDDLRAKHSNDVSVDLQTRLDLEAAMARAAAAENELENALTKLEETSAKTFEVEAERQELATRLAELEDKYSRVSVQNRELYNAVQDAKGALRVFCRVRPAGATGDAAASVVEPGAEPGTIKVWSAKHRKWHNFRFDAVFGPEARQPAVYAETAPLVRSVLDGYNVCIFAYGQTGSGKTHTMQGGDGLAEERGVNYRTLDDLFALRDERQGEVEYTFKVQLLEIYNECLRDLLVDDDGRRSTTSRASSSSGGPSSSCSLSISTTARSGFNVPEARQVEVSCAEDVLEVMTLGARNRSVAETRMNERSSRSHLVLSILVEGRAFMKEEEVCVEQHSRNSNAQTQACLHLIDLAGSERVGRSGAEGKQLLEAQHINRSLSALGGVLQSLASKASHVPFRDSKLTQLLQDSLSGGAKTMMFVHVAPEESSVSETLSTLNFGKGVTEITLGAAKKNLVMVESMTRGGVSSSSPLSVKVQEKHNAELEAARSRADALEREVAELRRQLEESKRIQQNGEVREMSEASGRAMSTTSHHRSKAPVDRSSSEAPEEDEAGGTIPAYHGSITTSTIQDRITTATREAPSNNRRLSAASPVSRLPLGKLVSSPAGSTAGSRIGAGIPPAATARSSRASPFATSSSIPRPMSARTSADGRRVGSSSTEYASHTKAEMSRLGSKSSLTSSKSSLSLSADTQRTSSRSLSATNGSTSSRRWA